MTQPAVSVRSSRTGARFAVTVVPRGSQNGVAGVRDGALLVRVTAPPVDGAANDAVVAVLARALGVARRDVTIAGGRTSRRKVVDVAAIDVATLAARLAALLN